MILYRKGYQINEVSRTFRSSSAARRRWEMAFFSEASISAKVRSSPSGINRGSYPNPSVPRGEVAITPFTIPSARISLPLRIRAMTVRKRAARSVHPSRRSSSSREFASASWPSPRPLLCAYRADSTPGSPSRAFTSNPVSSAKQSHPDCS